MVLFYFCNKVKLGFVAHYVSTNQRDVLSTFLKVVPCAQQRPPRRRIAVSFLPSFFLCGSCHKEKSVIKGKLTFDTKTF